MRENYRKVEVYNGLYNKTLKFIAKINKEGKLIPIKILSPCKSENARNWKGEDCQIKIIY